MGERTDPHADLGGGRRYRPHWLDDFDPGRDGTDVPETDPATTGALGVRVAAGLPVRSFDDPSSGSRELPPSPREAPEQQASGLRPEDNPAYRRWQEEIKRQEALIQAGQEVSSDDKHSLAVLRAQYEKSLGNPPWSSISD